MAVEAMGADTAAAAEGAGRTAAEAAPTAAAEAAVSAAALEDAGAVAAVAAYGLGRSGSANSRSR